MEPKFQLTILLLCLFSHLQLTKSGCSPNERWSCGPFLRPIELDINYMRSEDLPYKVITHSLQSSIPKSFDARQKWKNCSSINKVVDQGQCAICWAVAASMVMSDRLCIMSGGKDLFEFSIQDVATCCDDCYAYIKNKGTTRCEAGSVPISAFKYMFQHGVTSTSCKPFNWTTVDQEVCQKGCSDPKSSKDKRFLETVVYTTDKQKNFIRNVQLELMNHGPLFTAVNATKHFEDNAGNGQVYVYPKGLVENFTGHTVRLIGWGEEKGVPYWLVANSWGHKWGRNRGFFKIRRGSNELGIEKFFVAGTLRQSQNISFSTGAAEKMKISKLLVVVIVVSYLLVLTNRSIKL